MKLIWLTVSTWIGTSPRAVHYYGRLTIETGERKYEDRIEQRVTHPLTAKELVIENKQGWASCGKAWLKRKKGDDSENFLTEAEVVHHALIQVRKLYPDGEYIIIKADTGCLSAMPILAAPERFQAEMAQCNALAEEWDKIDGYEKGERKRASEIDDEWLALVRKMFPGI